MGRATWHGFSTAKVWMKWRGGARCRWRSQPSSQGRSARARNGAVTRLRGGAHLRDVEYLRRRLDGGGILGGDASTVAADAVVEALHRVLVCGGRGGVRLRHRLVTRLAVLDCVPLLDRGVGVVLVLVKLEAGAAEAGAVQPGEALLALRLEAVRQLLQEQPQLTHQASFHAQNGSHTRHQIPHNRRQSPGEHPQLPSTLTALPQWTT